MTDYYLDWEVKKQKNKSKVVETNPRNDKLFIDKPIKTKKWKMKIF